MNVFFAVSIIAVSIFLDLLAGNLGFSIGLSIFVLGYFFLGGREFKTLIGAVVCGLIMDLIYDRNMIFAALLYPIILLFLWAYRKEDEARSLFDLILPGALIGALYSLGEDISLLCWSSRDLSFSLGFWKLVFNVATGVVLLPGITVLLDLTAHALGLPGCCGNSENMSSGHSRISLSTYQESRRYEERNRD